MVLGLGKTVLLKMVDFVNNVNFVTDRIFLFTLTARKFGTKFIALVQGFTCILWLVVNNLSSGAGGSGFESQPHHSIDQL